MKTEEFDYYLPQELIAQKPILKRDESRLLILDKSSGEIEHTVFKNITDYLKAGDVLVLNDTRVIPARLFGIKKDTGAHIEILLLKRKDLNTWEVMSKPAKRLKVGTEIVFDDTLSAVVKSVKDEGIRILEFKYEGVFEEILDRLGEVPLPPYIHEKLEDKERYQTVYSKEEGSAAAPTAGLHFTKELLDKIRSMGVNVCFITLHVGLGTFRPVMEDLIEEHKMHSEYYRIPNDVAEIIEQAKNDGRRVICVGTTTMRTLESAAEDKKLTRRDGWTDIFIYPPYKFKIADALITNFHLPKSTLIMLVSAFAEKDKLLKAYEQAVKEKYKFFSFGDAMFIK